jgi:hypothetical protein
VFKSGDIVFLSNIETSHTIEVIVEVKDFKDNEIISEKFLTIHKIYQGNGELGYQGLPDGGLISNKSVLSNASIGEIHFNLNRFDMYGLVKNTEILDQFKKTTSSIIQPNGINPPKKGLIA